MRKRDELTDPAGCMARALDDEMVFVLLGRDKAAPGAIRYWIRERIRLGLNRAGDPQVVEAEACAKVMEAERGAIRARLASPAAADPGGAATTPASPTVGDPGGGQ